MNENEGLQDLESPESMPEPVESDESLDSGKEPGELVGTDIGKLGHAGVKFDGQKIQALVSAKIEETVLNGLVSVEANVNGILTIQLKDLLNLIFEKVKAAIKGPIDDVILDAIKKEIEEEFSKLSSKSSN